ncbi:MAG: thiamine pyrophosphate-binding protein, partial [Rhodospirillaceae bacterium]|nr:thiamine pyrophosphate-binding protein [Rhodospirillaceae bacterium]
LNGAEAFVRSLQANGVTHIFGLCGDTTLPLYDALFRLDHGITHILTRDERSAAYMADGYARVTGRVGVCEGPSGGGATYLLPGLAESNESSVPVLGINSDISTSSRGRFALTELDLTSLYAPVTKWNKVIDRPEDVPSTLREAFIQMTTGRPGAVHIGLPFDVQRGELDSEAMEGAPIGDRYQPHRTEPDSDAVSRAADVLLAAKNPLIVCGGGVMIAGAEDELRQLSETLAIPVATSISGRGTLPDSHALSAGVVGSNGGVAETRELVEQADAIFYMGCRAGSVTTERWQYPAPGSVRIVHVDMDERVIGANYEPDAAIVGDAKAALSALNREITARNPAIPDRMLNAAAVAAARQAKFDKFHALAASDTSPILPERFVAALQSVLPEDYVVVADPGTPCPYLSAYLQINRPGRNFFSNRAHGALGYAMSAAVGAQYGRPNATVFSVSGDGSFGFCVGELETIARLKVPVKMIVLSNSVYGWIKAGQKSGYDGRYYSVDFDPTDHARVAEAYGIKAWRVTDPGELVATLRAALKHDGPTLVDVVSQPLQDAQAPVSEWVA